MSFFYFTRRLISAGLILAAFSFTGCSLFDENDDQEVVTISLPEWPPQTENETADTNCSYPPISRWKITLAQNDHTSIFYQEPDTVIKVSTQKNCPFSIQAAPVTLLKNGNECLIFHPSGYIYPSSSEAKLTWEQGYAAFLMEGLYKNCRQNGFSAPQAARYMSTFNWEKLISYIQEQINKSVQDGKKFYNPWLCDSGKIIKNLSNETFRASLLNSSGCYQLSAANLRQNYEITILSPFIPENQIIKKTGQITIKKDSPLILTDGKEFGLFINYLSAKNVQFEYIYIPIYKEEL